MQICLFGFMNINLWQNIGLCVTANVARWPLSVTLSSPLTHRPEVTETRCPECVSVSGGEISGLRLRTMGHKTLRHPPHVTSQHSQDQSWAKLVRRDLHYKGPIISQWPGSSYFSPEAPQILSLTLRHTHLYFCLSQHFRCLYGH